MVFCEVFLLHSISNAELLTKLISIGLVCVYCVRKRGQLAGLWIWGYDAGYEAEALPAKVGLPNFEEPGRGGKGGRGGRRVTTALLQIALCRAQIAPLFLFNMSHCPFAVTSDSGKRGFVQCRAQCSLR